MTEDRKADMLRKVRAMLAKADSTDEQGEADVFRAKAEALMLKYRITEWEIGQTAEDNRPIGETRDFKWYWDSQHGSRLWLMMLDVAQHCRVKVVHWKAGREIPIVGLPSDIEYFDMLFTSLMLEMGKGLEPQPTKDQTFLENLVMLKDSGQQWNRICDQLHALGQMPPEYDEFAPGNYLTASQREAKRKFIHKMNLAGKYKKVCVAEGREPLKVTPKVYQRSFAYGFTEEINSRLREIRNRARREQTSAESSGMDLVLADIYTRAGHKAVELYGNPPQSNGRSGGKGRTVKIDYSAVADGRAAAAKVDLGQTKVTPGRGSLPQGS